MGEGDLMEDPMWVSMMVWTTWLLIAIIIDGVMVPIKMYFSRKSMHQVGKITLEKKLPTVSVVVPAHNEEEHIESCLLSIIQNEYPDKKMEIIVVDDGSRDNTTNLVKKIEVDAIMHGVDLKLIKKGHTGKVHTLNTGIRSSKGEIIITIDADIRLDEYAVKNVVQAFVEDEKVGAATGYIEIEWDEIQNEDIKSMFFSKCEFLEYLSSFNFERSYQSVIDSIYTMSGAFSAFRRNIIGGMGGYWPVTVSEDMHITMMLHNKKINIVNVPTAVAHAQAITDYDTLYSQRVRWARGQLEVAAMRQDKSMAQQETSLREILGIVIDQKDPRMLSLVIDYIKKVVADRKKRLKGRQFRYFDLLGLQRILFVDHTIAFPRLIWVFVLLLFPIMGLYTYLLPVIMVLMYLFYVLIDVAVILFSYHYSPPQTRDKIEKSFHYVALLPLYRLITFCFRVSAFLHILNEPADWKVEGPLNGFKNGVKDAKDGFSANVATTIFQIGHIFNLSNLWKRRGK